MKVQYANTNMNEILDAVKRKKQSTDNEIIVSALSEFANLQRSEYDNILTFWWQI